MRNLLLATIAMALFYSPTCKCEITNLTFAAKIVSYDNDFVIVEFTGGKKLKVKRSLFKAKKLAAGDAALVSMHESEDIDEVMGKMAKVTK